jgi:hypothetical protein
MTVGGADLPSWPELPQLLKDLLNDIEAETEDDSRHPRPWELASLPDALHPVVWQWLPQAVAWINRCYAWQPEVVIPPCWREHPHLALELAVLAFGRELAYRSTKTQDPSEWHNDLQAMQTRMVAAVGAIALTECQKGTHRERPAAYELEHYERCTALAHGAI